MKYPNFSWYFLGFVLSVFLFVSPVLTANTDIVINEIGAYEPNGNEWIEIFNRGDEGVDLTGWKFWEAGVNHGLNVIQGENILGAGEFAVIVQDDVKFLEKYPLVTSTIFDSSWGSLSEDGEEIGLKFGVGENDFVEKFVYVSSSEFSLERMDFLLDDYTVDNWKEHASGNTVGVQNSNVVVEEEEIEEDEVIEEEVVEEVPEPEEPEPIEEEEPEVEEEVFATPTPKIVLNEFLSDPAEGKEWIELLNMGTSSISLEGFTLSDGAGVIAQPTSTLDAGAFFVIELSASKLNNSGDIIILKNGETIIDTVSFGEWDDGDVSDNAVVPAQGYTLARIEGVDSDEDKQNWQETTTVTKGSANILTAPVPPPPKKSSNQTPAKSDNSKPEVLPMKSFAPGIIVINEVFPNPKGSDNMDEFIELLNTSSSSVSLVGWKLQDKSGKSYTIVEKVLEPGAYVAFLRKVTNISLNNIDEETVLLFDPSGKQLDEVKYFSTSTEDKSFSKTEEKNFVWTEPTPEKKNVFVVVEEKEVISVDEVEIKEEKVKQDFSGLKISEVFPAPVKHELSEFIEIFNAGDVALDLSGLFLDDNEKGSKPYHIPEGTTIDPGQYLAFFAEETKIILNNGVDSARLLDENKSVLLEVAYTKIKQNQSYVQNENDEWIWTTDITPEEENILTNVIEDDEQAPKKVLGQKITAAYEVPLSKIRELEKGERVVVEGIVAVLPGVLGSQYFYIVDETSGVQVYSSKKDFPELNPGDVVRVTGELRLAYGETRLKTHTKTDMVVLNREGRLMPQEVEAGMIDESLEGAFVKITGDVTEVKSSYMYIDDGTTELKVAFKPGTLINKNDAILGSQVSVQGIVAQSQLGYQLLPRQKEDIILQKETVEEETLVLENPVPEKRSFTYLWGVLVACLAIGGGLWWKRKG